MDLFHLVLKSSAIEYFGGWSGLGVAVHKPLFVVAGVGRNCSSLFKKLPALRKLCGVKSFEQILSCEKYKIFYYEGNQRMNYFLSLVVVSIWWLSGMRIHAMIGTSQRLGMSLHQKRRTDLRNLAGTSKWSPDHKRCFNDSSSWNDVRWLCNCSFSNKNTRVPPVKKIGLVQAFGGMTPEITGSHIYQHVLMATRAPGSPDD